MLADLLASPGATPEERYLAATSLRSLCRRQKGLAEPEAAAPLARLLAGQLAVSAAVNCWHTGNQLAAALAALAARTSAWPPKDAAPQLLALAQGALAAARLAPGSQQLALLRLLAALAEAALAKDTGMHPQRREELQAALLASPLPLLLLPEALAGAGGGPGSEASSATQLAALQLLQAWCSLGAPPAEAEQYASLWRQLHLAALLPGELGSAAAEAAAALYACCSAHDSDGDVAGSIGSDPAGNGGGAGQAQRLRQVLALLLSQLPEYAAGLQRALATAPGQQQQGHALFAALTLLGAASRAADSRQWGPACAEPSGPGQAVHLATEAALAALQHPKFEVNLAGLQQMDEQLERWAQHQAAEQRQRHDQAGQRQQAAACRHRGSCTPEQRRALLGRLCGGLLQRMVLPAGLPAACVTADARDLPDDVGVVSAGRRQLSASGWQVDAVCACLPAFPRAP